MAMSREKTRVKASGNNELVRGSSSRQKTASTELVAGFAHEIRNPLTVVKVLLKTLPRAALPENAQQDLAMADKQIERMENIVNGFINTARAEIGAPQMRPVDLSNTANETVLLLASSTREGTRLELSQKDGLLPVFGDPTQLSQVIYNLALNAIEAAGKGGRVSISTGIVDGQLTEDGGRKVYIEVADDGPGFNPVIKERLFTPSRRPKKMASAWDC